MKPTEIEESAMQVQDPLSAVCLVGSALFLAIALAGLAYS